MEHNPDVPDKEHRKAAETRTAPHAQTQTRRFGGLNWTEALFLLFLAGLAVLPPDYFGGNDLHVASMLGLTGLVAAVFGHSFSCFTRFKGGKGVATASGGLLVLMPLPGLIAILVWTITFFASRYVSLASLLGTLAVPVAAWSLGLPLALKIVAAALALLVVVRHYANIRRLLAGTEHRWERKPEKGAS